MIEKVSVRRRRHRLFCEQKRICEGKLSLKGSVFSVFVFPLHTVCLCVCALFESDRRKLLRFFAVFVTDGDIFLQECGFKFC